MPDRVLSANPDGGCTHNATVLLKDGTNSEVANIQYRRFKEEGTITLSHPVQTYKVTHSTNSGIWNLQLDDAALNSENISLIVATKPKWYRPTVTFEMGDEVYEMVHPSWKKRDYVVGRLGKEDIAEANAVDHDGKKKKTKGNTLRGTKVGELLTDSSVKRSYTIRFDDDIRVELALFCYWMVSLFNKRQNSNSGAAGAY